MKRVFILIVLGLFLLSSVSAEIIFDKQPAKVQNLGDVVNIPVTIKTLQDVSGTFMMNLICEGRQTTFYQNGVSLKSGEEKKIDASLILDGDNGAVVGDCKVKAIFGDEYKTTNIFKVSDVISIQTKLDNIDFNPGESMVVKGNAIKENGDDVNGFITLKLVTGNETGDIEQLSAITNGFFSINITLPEDFKAGNHLVQLNAYELNSKKEETNKGFINYNIHIKQVPTSLEISLDSQTVKPGDKLKAKVILHDQTGEGMNSDAIVSIKKSKSQIVKQMDVSTGEDFEYQIPSDEPPANWTVVAVSNMLNAEMTFFIPENKEVNVEFVNGTILVENTGNVPYNDTLFVKIGENSSLNLDVYLDVGESKKYSLNAPDGEYFVEVVGDGETKFGDNVLLTGRAIDVKELNKMGIGFSGVFVWIFIIIILGVVGFIIYKKGYKKSFFGSSGKKKVSSPKVNSNIEEVKFDKNNLFETSSKAVLSLSIKGEKHDSSIVSLKIKNYKDLKKEAVSDSIGKIVAFAESKKAMIYENQGDVFFIFSALKTKTFKNEKDAIELAQKVAEILKNHNRLFKQRIEFGISVSFGSLVGKVNHSGVLEFMAMGNLIGNSKKISSLSNGEILLSKDFKDRASSFLKADEKTIEGKTVYTIKEVRDREQHAKFISNFLHNLEKDKEERRKRESRE